MKNHFLFICIIWAAIMPYASSQYIPNGGFENWEIRVLFSEPESWNTGNQQAFLHNVATALNTNDSYSGNSALRLETVVVGDEVLFGYAACNGTVTGGSEPGTFNFFGGIPVSNAPDYLSGYYKFNIPENDTAIALLFFKKEGIIIGQNIYPIYGIQNTYAPFEWEIEPLFDIPDTAMLAFACSNPDNPVPGGWLQIDSVWFGGIDDTIPNADFEVWDTSSYLDPVNWLTTNILSHLFGGDTCATPTMDAHSGNYAIRIESVETNMPAESGMTSAVFGFAIPYSTSFNFMESIPTFDVNFHPIALTGYYKFEPLLNDTAMVFINLTAENEQNYQFGTFLLPAENYTPFHIALTYPSGTMITEASIIASTTIYFMQGNEQSGEIGSVLYLDDIDLINPCDAYPAYKIYSINYPECEGQIALLNAGEGWDTYLWSTHETTQTIDVQIIGSTTISVTVTDSENVCSFSDEVVIELPICDPVVEISENFKPHIHLYPNPTSGIFRIEFLNLKGTYAIDLVDITGKTLLTEKVNINQNKRSVVLDMTKYSEGLYLVKISGNTFNSCERLMLVF